MFFEIFWLFWPKIDCFALFLGKRGPPCENIDRDLHFAPVVGPFWSWKKIQEPESRNFRISNIDEVDRTYMASPRGLSGGKTEPPDYILMFSSANVPGITCKSVFLNLCPPFLKKKLFESSTKFANLSSNSVFFGKKVTMAKSIALHKIKYIYIYVYIYI